MKLDYEKRQEVNRLMEAAQDDLEGVIFELVGQLAAERTGRADDFRSLSETNLQLRQQLAAEREKYEAACEGRDQFKAQLSDADKQLAAERERLENDEVHRQQAVQEIYADKLADLEAQLDAERNRADSERALADITCKQIEQLREQLAAAQAMIVRLWHHKADIPKEYTVVLDAYVAEAQKPLVDALMRIRIGMARYNKRQNEQTIAFIDAALAKVKQ